MGQFIAMKQAQAEQNTTTLAELATPCLVLNAERMARNIARLKARLDRLGVTLRPHLKTLKSVNVARRAMPSPSGPATVSTLLETEQFAAAGVRDIIYAIGISPAKLPQVLALRAGGADVSVVLDAVQQAQAVAQASRPSRGARRQQQGRGRVAALQGRAMSAEQGTSGILTERAP